MESLEEKKFTKQIKAFFDEVDLKGEEKNHINGFIQEIFNSKNVYF